MILKAGMQVKLMAPQNHPILSIEHHHFGLEKFKVAEARWNLYQAGGGIREFVVNVEKLKVELAEVTEEWIQARVTGFAQVNDGRLDRISIEAKFRRDSQLRRGIQ